MPRKQVANGDLGQKVDALTKRVDALEASRPGRKAKPMLYLKQHGVCALDADRDSTTCPDASIFRYQQGCHGHACRAVQHASYVRRKNKRASTATRVPAPRKKAVAKKVPIKKAAAKKTVAKKAAPRRVAKVAGDRY